jgi:FAD/FMN-containing dehydrogenase
MQGGGHGPASRQFGLGADQVLSARVVLADGCIITASPCENQDFYYAIRGGGPGTYGVVLSTVIKAWPMVDAQVQSVAIAPLTTNTTALLDAIAILYSAYPDLNDAGYAGYGTWSIAFPTPILANFTAGYVHGFYTFNKTMEETQNAFTSTLEKLLPFNGTSLFISVTYSSFDDYWTFYNAVSGVEPPVGTTSALGSRLFSRASVQEDTPGLRSMLDVIAGSPEEFTSNNFELVSGGQVFKDAADPYSGLNPAWRISYFNNIVARGWAPGSSEDAKAAVMRDITHKKVPAMEKQAPDTGVYMNEADKLDPNWQTNFYGDHYERLLEIKQKRDPRGVFYCPTCVGSAAWKEDEMGRLCRIS